jgi:hypothetical protein
MPEPDDKGLFRERLRATKHFAPAGLLMAEEMGRRLPVPHDAVMPGSPDEHNPGMLRHALTIPRGVTHRLKEYADMRGISFNRLCSQLLTYYVCGITDEQMEMVPAFLADMHSPAGVRALAQALAMAYNYLDMKPMERPVMRQSDAEFGSDISEEEKERLQNW